MIARALAAKIALIIPRLGSIHDGEIVATVRAIGRTLTAANLDWHDLAATVVDGLPTYRASAPPPRHSGPVPPLWSELDPCDREGWLAVLGRQGWLSQWDRDFIASIAEQVARDPFRRFSQKQQVHLNRLIGRSAANGART